MKKTIIFLLSFAVLGALFWLFKFEKSNTIDVVTPQRISAVQAVYATGTVEAEKMISISPKISARLMELLVDEGQTVESGQVLAQLEDADMAGSLKELEAKLDLAKRDLARAQKLSRTGAISKEGLEQAQATYKSTSASVDSAKAQLSFLKLIAPDNGTIIRRDGEIGELIPSGQSVFWMSGGTDIRITTEVDEEDIALIKIGQKVLISADAFSGKVFHGNVQSITPKGDPIARSYRVRIAIDGQNLLMIGMTAETNIITQEKDNAMMVPTSAVKESNILIIEDRKAKKVAVSTGIKNAQSTEITGGISDKQIVVKTYDESLTNKERISTSFITWAAKGKDKEDEKD